MALLVKNGYIKHLNAQYRGRRTGKKNTGKQVYADRMPELAPEVYACMMKEKEKRPNIDEVVLVRKGAKAILEMWRVGPKEQKAGIRANYHKGGAPGLTTRKSYARKLLETKGKTWKNKTVK